MAVPTDARDPAKLADSGIESKEFGGNARFCRLRDVKHWIEVAGMRPMFLQICRTFPVKETASPRELLAHRAGPDHRRQRGAKCSFELGALHRAKPGTDELRDPRDIRPRRRFPVVERLLSFHDERSLDSADTNDPPKLAQYIRDAIRIGLVDPGLDASLLPICPALAVEEAGGPGEIVRTQPRELGRTQASCLSSKRANTSHKVSTASAIFDDMPGTNVRVA